MLAVAMSADKFWHLQRSNCRNTMIYMHTTLHTLLVCDISLGSLI